jgi:hypothetical protein
MNLCGVRAWYIRYGKDVPVMTKHYAMKTKWRKRVAVQAMFS